MDNLSEEEKIAIDYYINNEYSFGFETDMDIESFKKAIGIEETDEDTWEKHQIRFKTLLNLIEKQQKELEQEKEKNKELFLQYEKEVDKLEYQITTMISKDKIEKTFDNYSESSLMLNNTFIEFKKDLLGEEYWQY